MNFPLLFTFVCDHLLALLFGAVCVLTLGDLKFTPFRAGVAMLVLVLPVLHLREWYYMSTLGSYFAPIKMKEQVYTRANILAAAKVVVLFTVAIPAVTWLGVLHFRVSQGLLRTCLLVSFEYWMMAMLKDNICMRFGHALMHSPKYYHLHKTHHIVHRNLTIFSAYSIDYPDLVIENMGAVLIGAIANKLLFGTLELHLASFFFLVWTDGTIHSANPWSLATFNPILDYFMKLNITHNLHHSEPNKAKYFTIYTWSHLWGNSRDSDVALYNKLLGTDVTFELDKCPSKASK